jgi:hypothetical protein
VSPIDGYSIEEDSYYRSVQFGNMVGSNFVLYSKEND